MMTTRSAPREMAAGDAGEAKSVPMIPLDEDDFSDF